MFVLCNNRNTGTNMDKEEDEKEDEEEGIKELIFIIYMHS